MEKMYDKTGERIKAMRMAQGLTQVMMQERTGIGQSELSKIERDCRRPTLAQLGALAIALETSMDYLACITDEKKPYPAAKMR